MNELAKSENDAFENEVRRIARLLWPEDQYAGSRKANGREFDGVFETEECIHIVEATTSRKKEKADCDIKKMVSLASKLQAARPFKAVKCWFITKEEPTADQRGCIRKGNASLVVAVSYSQFQAKIIDTRAYLISRDNYRFGSVRDPQSGGSEPTTDYIPLDMMDVATKQSVSVGEIIDGLHDGRRYVVLGDYGAGKSMTLRHIYRKLKDDHLSGKTSKFPVYVNLRDHYGQQDPAEAIERHARSIGFTVPFHLIRAWRAGFVILLIDGFDEVAAVGIQGLWRKLRDNRFRAMSIVRRFVDDHPSGRGMVIAGRAHFFDSDVERKSALRTAVGFTEVTLNEFSDEQIGRYLKNSHLTGRIPLWMPCRPLLVGYLAAKGLVSEISARQESDPLPDPAAGWDYLLDKISEREAEIDAGIDGPTVRKILERLATKARAMQDGIGSITTDQVMHAFEEVCGYTPDEKALVVLQRLPGLGIERADEGTRSFIDQDFADACRSGDLVEFVQRLYSFDTNILSSLECVSGTLGVEIAALKLKAQQISAKQINTATKIGQERSCEHVLADLVRVAFLMGYPIDGCHIRGVLVPELQISRFAGDCSRVTFEECYFQQLGIDLDIPDSNLPRFKRCYFGEIDGKNSRSELAPEAFDADCVIDIYLFGPKTTDAILDLEVPLGTKVLMTVLRKLYLQRGRGRMETALHRGLDHHGRRLVPKILALLQSEGLASPYRGREIWLPDRSYAGRVARILRSPHTSDDPIVIKSKTLD